MALMLLLPTLLHADEPAVCPANELHAQKPADYVIGPDDILTINIVQPEQMENIVTVSPAGNINFPYIGNVVVKGRTLEEVHKEIQQRLGEGYLKYPIVVVGLKESHSRKFFVYGEVTKPGTYPLEENTTVLRAISMAEGFSRFGSASRVKVLRPRQNDTGYETLKVNVKDMMDGDCNADMILQPGDIVVISEGVL